MSCVKDITLLERYIDGELPEVLSARVEIGLESCGHCRDELNALMEVRSALQDHVAAAVAAAPLDGLFDRIEGQLDDPTPARVPFVERLRTWWQTQRLEAALSLAVAAAAIAVVFWVGGSLPERSATEPSLAEARGGDNTLIVESYEVQEGTVIIDVDPDDPTAPAVVWHYVDAEEDEG